MPYLGNEPATAYTSTTKDTFSGDASTTDFTMSKSANVNAVRVVVENVVQNPTVAYTCSGTTLSFTSAPPTGTNNIYVVHLGPPAATVAPPTTINNATTFTGNLTIGGTSTNTGLITASAGVAIGGTSSPNTLDDYEEGVHQTAITMSSSGTVTLNTSYDSLSYTKVGRLVTITGHPRIASVSSPVGSMYLSLPFTSKNGEQDESRSGGVLNYYDNSGGSGSYYKLLAMQINQNSNLLGINNTHTDNFNLTPAASDEIYLNFCYITD